MSQPNPQRQQWLEDFLAQWQAVAGTVHRQENGCLYLDAWVAIPPVVVTAVAVVPNGKGMAGLALERKQPVQTCNLQEDNSGAVKPGARAVDARAGIALPVLDDTGEVRAVVGMAWPDEREIDAPMAECLQEATGSLPG